MHRAIAKPLGQARKPKVNLWKLFKNNVFTGCMLARHQLTVSKHRKQKAKWMIILFRKFVSSIGVITVKASWSGRDVTARLVTALILSRLDYCNAVLAGLLASTLAPLQRVLHAAASTVLDLKPCDRVTPALRELHWLPVAERIQNKLCLLVHKSLLGHTPEYISDLLASVASIPGRYTVWVKKVAPLKLFAIFSPRLTIFPWNFASMLSVHIYTYLPILVDLS